jgi:hypothetical protein
MEPDGTPYAMKVARTVWIGGKAGDNTKSLPIAISHIVCEIASVYDIIGCADILGVEVFVL